MKCTVVYHIAFEDLGSFADVLRERGYAISYRHAGADPLAPAEWTDADLVVVLGGPIGAGDRARYPWLDGELAGLGTRLGLGLPTLGICLGAQLMAAALGGGVTRRLGVDGRPQSETGWGLVDLVQDAGVLEGLRGQPVLHWHGDNILPPPGAVTLAATPGTPCQAFAVGRHALGLQFHAEFAAAALEAWLSGHAVELAQGRVDLDLLRRDSARHGAALERAARGVLTRWLDAIAPASALPASVATL